MLLRMGEFCELVDGGELAGAMLLRATSLITCRLLNSVHNNAQVGVVTYILSASQDFDNIP